MFVNILAAFVLLYKSLKVMEKPEGGQRSIAVFTAMQIR